MTGRTVTDTLSGLLGFELTDFTLLTEKRWLDFPRGVTRVALRHDPCEAPLPTSAMGTQRAAWDVLKKSEDE